MSGKIFDLNDFDFECEPKIQICPTKKLQKIEKFYISSAIFRLCSTVIIL